MNTSPSKALVCRVCAGPLHGEPLLDLHNLPSAAQQMPDAAGLATDRGCDLAVSQCTACGLIQLPGKPVSYYREVIRATGFSEEMKAFRGQQFGEFIQRHGLQGKKIIEIGCGGGEYLHLLHQQPVVAHGLEFAAASVRHCVKQGLSAAKGFVSHSRYPLKQAPYAAFFMLSFLEHVPAPHHTLRGIAHNLSPGGVGLVEVPNFDMIVGQGLFAEFIRDHLFYFTGASLTQLLSQNGFEVLECRPVWHNYILSATVKKRTPTDLTHLRAFQEGLHQQIHRYLAQFTPGRVAIWGAGHQALTLLSLCQLQEKICYVVDSAPFKQGRFTQATHLPIVPPDHLLTDPVEAVVVMAASYADEVAAILRANYSPTLGVAVVRGVHLEVIP